MGTGGSYPGNPWDDPAGRQTRILPIGQPVTPPDQHYQETAYPPPVHRDEGRKLLAGKFDPQRLTVNLTVLGILAAVVTFAVVLIVDRVVATLTVFPPATVPAYVVTGVATGIVGVGVGLSYMLVVDTGNDALFGIAVIALTVAGVAVCVLGGGLLSGDWSQVPTVATIVCIGITAYAAPRRVDAARVG